MKAWLDADWPAPPGVRALTTLRHGLGGSLAPFDALNLGLRCGDDTNTVIENRQQLAAALELTSTPRWLRQVHGVDVACFGSPHPSRPPQAGEGDGSRPLPLPPLAGEGVDELLHVPFPPNVGEGVNELLLLPLPPLAGEGWDGGALVDVEPEADAAVTSTPGTMLAILTADCLPVVFAAQDGSEIAAAHAGWRGLAGGVLEATLATMRTPAANVIAWLGPCAGPQAYEIGQDVFDAFVLRDANAAVAFVATRPGHWRVDLYALARLRLVKAGVEQGNIHGGDLCTISEPSRFFSHRRDQRTGRMATLVWRSR